jgi:hypothetical protein
LPFNAGFTVEGKSLFSIHPFSIQYFQTNNP